MTIFELVFFFFSICVFTDKVGRKLTCIIVKLFIKIFIKVGFAVYWVNQIGTNSL